MDFHDTTSGHTVPRNCLNRLVLSVPVMVVVMVVVMVRGRG